MYYKAKYKIPCSCGKGQYYFEKKSDYQDFPDSATSFFLRINCPECEATCTLKYDYVHDCPVLVAKDGSFCKEIDISRITPEIVKVK